MRIFQKLRSVTAIRWVGRGVATAGASVVGEAGADALGTAAEAVIGHFRDPGRKVADALTAAQDQAWTLLQAWLEARNAEWWKDAGHKAIRARIGAILDRLPPLELHGSALAFRTACVAEIKALRGKEVGDAAWTFDPEALGQFGTHGNAAGLIAAARRLQDEAIESLRPDCPQLARLLEQVPDLLPDLVDFLFDQAVARDEELGRQVMWSGQQRIGDRIEDLFRVVAELDQRLRDQARERAEAEKLGREQVTALHRHDLETRPLAARDGLSYRDDKEREALLAFRDRLRGMPADERRLHPELLVRAVKVVFVAGDFAAARDQARELIAAADNEPRRAEGHALLFQAALALADADLAIEAYRGAVRHDATRYQLFDEQKYEPVAVLGAGGFGVVFLVRRRTDGRPRAIKCLVKHDLDRAEADLFDEVGALEDLGGDYCPSLIRSFDHDYVDRPGRGRPYLVMEYFPGTSLDKVIQREGVLAPRDALLVMGPVAAALKVVHERGYLHRDVKPANVLVVRKEGGGWDVRLIDFGLAYRQATLDAVNRTTDRGQSFAAQSIAGTLDYIAPELRARTGKPSPRSDLYSFGRTLAFTLFKHFNPGRRDWERLRARHPADVEAIRRCEDILADCLANEPEDRPETVAEVIGWIEQGLGDRPATPKTGGSAPPIEEPRQLDRDTIRDRSRTEALMVPITPGEFLMGSPNSDKLAYDREKPQRKITLTRDYEIGMVPVTQALYEAVMGVNPSRFKGDGDRPVESLTWFDAVNFCNKLSARDGKRLFYDINGTTVTVVTNADGYRLPTEAEWECACRAGTETIWPWGDDPARLGDHAWFKENSGGQTHPVASKEKNRYGLYDTLGNVWEWCQDWYDDNTYKNMSTKDPVGPSGGSLRVDRGGSWDDEPRHVRPAYRDRNVPARSNNFLGFRLARTLS